MTNQADRPYQVQRLTLRRDEIETHLNRVHERGWDIISVSHIERGIQADTDEWLIVVRKRDRAM